MKQNKDLIEDRTNPLDLRGKFEAYDFNCRKFKKRSLNEHSAKST